MVCVYDFGDTGLENVQQSLTSHADRTHFNVYICGSELYLTLNASYSLRNIYSKTTSLICVNDRPLDVSSHNVYTLSAVMSLSV